MRRIGRGKRAGYLWLVADFSVSVFAAGRTWRDFPIPIQFDIIRYVVFSDTGASVFSVHQSPFIYRTINLSHIVDASIGRTGIRVLVVVPWDCDRSNK